MRFSSPRRLGAILIACVMVMLMAPVPLANAETPASSNHVMLLLDTSGSMRDDDGTGRLKIAGAKAGLISLINQLPTSARVGLMTYPGDVDCGPPKVHYPVQRIDSSAFSRTVSGLPEPNGNTPTGLALQTAADQLGVTSGAGTIVLVSDGLSTCGPPPCEVAQALMEKGVSVTVNTIGFRVDAAGAKELQCVADATNGRAVTVDDGVELGEELARQMRPLLSLEVTIPERVEVTASTAPVVATITNASGLTATGVQVSLTPVASDAFLGVVGPVVQWGNLAPKEARTQRWNLQVSPLLEGQTIRVRVRVTAINAAPVERMQTIQFAALGESVLPKDSPLSQFRRVLLLGDSFSSGDGAYTKQTDYVDYKASLKATECRRSDSTYAHVLFGAENVTNLACSGAVLQNLATKNDLSGAPQIGDMTQLQQLDYRLGRGERFDAVFLTLGGNDVGFVDIVTACSPDLNDLVTDLACPLREGSPAKPYVDLSVQAVSYLLSRTYPRVADAFTRHGLASPPIIVSAYPMMTPNDPKLSGACGWGGPLQNLAISKDDLVRYAAFQRQLNQAVGEAVSKAAAAGTPVYFADETAWAVQPDHTACAVDPWINPVTRDAMRPDKDQHKNWSTPLHPNKAGHRAWALALARWSQTSGELKGSTVPLMQRASRLLSAAPAGTITSNGGLVTTGGNDLVVTGLAPGSLVLARLNSRVYPLAVGTADDAGTFRARVYVDPSFVPRGAHTLVLAVTNPDGSPEVRKVAVTVVAPVPYAAWVLGALGLAVAAVGLVGRRRSAGPTKGGG